MAEAHTSYNGRLITLQDEPLQDYVAEVNMVRQMFHEEGVSFRGLARHAEELKEIGLDTTQRMFGGERETASHWLPLVDLASRSGDLGLPFLDAHVYARTNRALAAEFGPDETRTTMVLRKIADRAIRSQLKTGTPRAVYDLFDYKFSSTMLDGIYPPIRSSDTHPDLSKHLKRAKSLPLPDPALARVISTLFARKSPDALLVPNTVRAKVMAASEEIFHDQGMRTPGAKSNAIDWGRGKWNADKKIKKTEVDKEIEEELAAAEATTAELDALAPDDADIVDVPDVNFDRKKAACYPKREKGMTDEAYTAIVAYRQDIMFPSRGEDTRVAKKEFCDNCVVREPCFDYALVAGMKHGIWGGESERGRRKIQKINIAIEDAS